MASENMHPYLQDANRVSDGPCDCHGYPDFDCPDRVTVHPISERQAVAEIASQVRDDIGAASIRLAAILARYPEARDDMRAAHNACTLLIQNLTGYTTVDY